MKVAWALNVVADFGNKAFMIIEVCFWFERGSRSSHKLGFVKNLIRNLLYGALGAARSSQKLGFVMNLLRNWSSGVPRAPRS